MNKIFLIIILAIILMIATGGIYFLLQGRKNPARYEIQGMKIEVLKEGTGKQAEIGDTVAVDYVGVLESGAKFDSSIDRGKPFLFKLGQNRVIRGWELGVLGMKAGEKRKLTIPPELAYGSQGAAGVIPPNATLIFEIKLLEFAP